jgi:TolB protein
VLSPNGEKIVFMSNRDGNFEIYPMNVDGTAQTRLTNDAAVDQSPAFSPDGRKIAFESDPSAGTSRSTR